ncbi:MAG: hypothetical protein RL380_1074 [Verrucomicrobiota bacterium]|jgi:YVTN family beta-propeller protein
MLFFGCTNREFIFLLTVRAGCGQSDGMKSPFRFYWLAAVCLSLVGCAHRPGGAGAGYEVFVSNEKAGTLTVIHGADFTVTATIPVGKRPRGIHASPDGKLIYVALSGTPIAGPPKLDANGKPAHEKNPAGDDNFEADKAADGIGVVAVAAKKFLRKIPAGSDPEQFSLSHDGRQLYVANEDIGTASVLDIASGAVVRSVRVGDEPEGVATSPDGKFFYVTCEAAGEVFAVDARTFQVAGKFTVKPRPRSADFLPDSSRAFVSSETSGELNVVDTASHTLRQTVALPPGALPMCVQLTPDGKKICVSTGRGGAVCVVDAATLALTATIKVGSRPWGIAISPDGKYLFAANGPSDDVSVVDLAAAKEVARVKSPGGPWGVAVVRTAR